VRDLIRRTLPSIGKSCIRFRRLGDLDEDVLVTLLRQAVGSMPRS
jgi:hypothetical protein